MGGKKNTVIGMDRWWEQVDWTGIRKDDVKISRGSGRL